LRTYIIIGIVVLLLIIAVVIYGIFHFGSVQPDFWKNFVPGMLANIVGVSIGAIVGVPVGLAINHYVASFTEQRHHRRQIIEVRQLLEQVKTELSIHLTRLTTLSTLFPLGSATQTSSVNISPATPTQQTMPRPQMGAADVIPLMLTDTSGQQLIGNRSVLEIGEMQVLFHVSSYYTRVSDINRLLSWRSQDQLHPETWDGKISDLAYTLSSTRAQLDYDIQQVLTKLSTT
jgi:hypothetical protein